jgi:hypothetical protein
MISARLQKMLSLTSRDPMDFNHTHTKAPDRWGSAGLLQKDKKSAENERKIAAATKIERAKTKIQDPR